jgi:hypothetical protein
MPESLAATYRIVKRLCDTLKYWGCRTWRSEPTDTVSPKDGLAIPYPVESAVSDFAGATISERGDSLTRKGSDYRAWQGLVE